jgi:hypothetical protein
MALEHVHVPHPVEEHRLQIFGVFSRRIGFRTPAPTGALRTNRQRQAERETSSDQNNSLKAHGRHLSSSITGEHIALK